MLEFKIMKRLREQDPIVANCFECDGYVNSCLYFFPENKQWKDTSICKMKSAVTYDLIKYRRGDPPFFKNMLDAYIAKVGEDKFR